MKPVRIATTENEARLHHYRAVIESPGFEWIGTLTPPFDAASLAAIDAFIVSCEHYLPSRLAIAACKKASIPTFHVLDGIIEWRNLFENPRSSKTENGAPLFQPLISDLTFALGPCQKWVLEWLGNDPERIIATGLPRLDMLPSACCRSGPTQGTSRLLIATANTPWFDDRQKSAFLEAFRGLVAGLQRTPESSTPLHCHWRVAPEVAKALAIPSPETKTAQEALAASDALITTPSSLAIEAMIMGIPTLVFDPYARPSLNPSAWNAHSASQVVEQLPGLIAPSPIQASLQDRLLALSVTRHANSGGHIAQIIQDFVSTRSINPTVRPRFESESVEKGDNSVDLQALRGLAATLPSLEKALADRDAEVLELLRERNHPTLRHCVGCLYRWLKSIVRK